MTKKVLNLHKFYSDDNYWLKVSRLALRHERTSLSRIRHDGSIPDRKKTLEKIVDFHKIIKNDNRNYEEVLVDLLSPVEESFISG